MTTGTAGETTGNHLGFSTPGRDMRAVVDA